MELISCGLNTAQPLRADLPLGLQSEAPEGFVENNGQLYYFSIPLQGGSNDCRIAPYIQLLDGPVPRAAGTLGGPDNPVFTTEVYAQPSSNVGVANPPVPKWLLRAIDGDSEIFEAFSLEVQDTTQGPGLGHLYRHLPLPPRRHPTHSHRHPHPCPRS
jgi:hypothetical protein